MGDLRKVKGKLPKGSTEELIKSGGEVVKGTADSLLPYAVLKGDLELIDHCVKGGADVFKEVKGVEGYKKGDTVWDVLHADKKLGDNSSAVVALALVKSYMEVKGIVDKDPTVVLKEIHKKLLSERKKKKIQASKNDYLKAKGKGSQSKGKGSQNPKNPNNKRAKNPQFWARKGNVKS